MKNTWDVVYSKKKKKKKKKEQEKKRRVPVSSGKTLRDLILCDWGGTEKLFQEIMAKIFPNCMESINKIQGVFKTRTMKKTIPRCITIKLLKTNDKENILEKSREKGHIKCRKTKRISILSRNHASEKTLGQHF